MSIPTMFAGVQMRSRLEARWAAFFTALGWNWEYEPFDLRGWIPDFLLRGSWGSVLVEVKPTTRFLPEIAKEMLDAATGTEWKPRDEELWPFDMVLVGTSPMSMEAADGAYCGFGESLALGWFPEGCAAVLSVSCPSEGRGAKRSNPSRFDLFNSTMSYHHRLTGAYDGDHFAHGADASEVTALWRRACNRTQWNAPVAVAT